MEIDIRSFVATDEDMAIIKVKSDHIDETAVSSILAILRKAMEQRGIATPCTRMTTRRRVVVIELFSASREMIKKTMLFLMEHLQEYASIGITLEEYLDRIRKGYSVAETVRPSTKDLGCYSLMFANSRHTNAAAALG